jgi:uncharacterized protein
VRAARPRDPQTLFVYWDHGAETLRRGWEGLDGGKAELWIQARRADGSWERVRVLDFALESRGWYVHDLEPGREYRAEIHLVDPSRDRLLPGGSGPARLPPRGASPIVDDRFSRMDWGEPLSRFLREEKAGGPFPEALRDELAQRGDWSRFPAGAGGAGAGEAGARPVAPPWAAPGAPTSPPGGER